MRYLVTARVKPSREADLLRAIESGSLGSGSVAGDEYPRNMEQARLRSDGTTHWVEVCFCELPLQEERLYWEEFFELTRVQDAHGRHRCRDLNGSEPWACSDCDCTERLEAKMTQWGRPFLEVLREAANTSSVCASCQGLGFPWVQSPPGNLVVPAGSSLSGGGGNDAIGSLGRQRIV